MRTNALGSNPEEGADPAASARWEAAANVTPISNPPPAAAATVNNVRRETWVVRARCSVTRFVIMVSPFQQVMNPVGPCGSVRGHRAIRKSHQATAVHIDLLDEGVDVNQGLRRPDTFVQWIQARSCGPIRCVRGCPSHPRPEKERSMKVNGTNRPVE